MRDVDGRLYYDRDVAPQAHRAQAAILKGRAAELPPPLLVAFGAHAEEQEDLRGRPAPTRPRSSDLARALIRLTSTCPRTSFPCVCPAERRLKMINEPPKAAAIVFLTSMELDSSLLLDTTGTMQL